jgi:alanine racemase
MQFSDLSSILNVEVIQLQADLAIIYLATDSRNISHGQRNTLFFAIDGQNHDGHSHIHNLYKQGVRQFILEHQIDISAMPEANVILVKSSVEALQDIAKHKREQYSLPVIAITGSNGKTIVKEWLYHLISPFHNVVKSPKSYNSQIGVPLSIWQMSDHHKLGIFEAGISTTGEIENLRQIIQPTYGIFTNIGSAHAEGFSSMTTKVSEKLKLFSGCDQLIYCKDHQEIHQQITDGDISAISWSFNTDADITAQVVSQHNGDSQISVIYKDLTLTLKIPFTDQASIENVMHCISTMLVLGYTASEIISGLKRLPAVKMRLELKPGLNNCQVIDDTYNNDLAGLEVALNFLSQQSSLSRTLILSDILQSGLSDQHLYQEIAQLVSSYKISRFIGVGLQITEQAHLFPDNSTFYQNTKELIGGIHNLDFNKEAILVKGARSFRFEQITSRLAQKIHGTVLEIDLNALTHNLNYYRQQLKSSTQLMVMVKAMAYGSGSNEIAHLLAHHKVDYLGVAYVDEGVALRQSGIETPIMVMNASPEGFDNILTYHLEPEIYSLSLLNSLIQFINGKVINIHLKIDTGMRRLGFHNDEINELITLLKKNPNIQIKSMFSHLAGSDEAIHNEFSKEQVRTLNNIYQQISTELNTHPIKHILNSSGILRFPEYHFDMVRLGIGLYGIDSNKEYQDQLLPISTLKTTISQVNQVKKGETIGYGRKGKADKDLTIATLAIGYADGFSRAFSNGLGEVMISSQLAPVIGNVCMDMMMIDVTGIRVSAGDEVIVFGVQPSITELSEKLNTIPYEILTNISERVKRVYFQD